MSRDTTRPSDASITDTFADTGSLADPDALRDSESVEYSRTRETVDAETFADVRDDLADTDGWVVVGVVDDDGAVLLMDDGSHGWTLPAVPVRDRNWITRGREAVAGLTGMTADVTPPERVRRLDYEEDGGDGHVVVHHVVLGAERVTGAPAADDPTVGCDGHPEVGWFDHLPDEMEGLVEDDARLFLP